MKYKKYLIEDVLKIKYGKNQKKVKDDYGDYPILGTGGLMGYANDFLYDKPSVLIGRKGSIRQVKYIDEPFWTVDTLFYTEINEDIVYPKYIYYYLSLIDFNYYNEGTTIPSLRTQTLNQIEISLPSKKEQKKVLNIINPIEKKIYLNNSIISNLEELAQTLFKHWFVDFEFPNENGEPYKSSGGKMVESELGMIPESWSIGEFNEIIKIGSGKRPNKRIEEESELFNTPVLGASKIMGYTDEILFDEPIVVIGRVGTHGVIQRITKSCWPSDNTFVLRSEYMEFMYQFLQTINYKSLNRGSTQPLLTQKDIKGIKLPIPIKNFLIKFEKQQQKFSDLIFQKKEENYYLRELRDTLLPKLLSGEIELPDNVEVTDDVPIS